MPDSAENSRNNRKKSTGKKRGNPDAIKAFQFKPGQSGNPGGRPKKTVLDEALKQLMETDVAEVLGTKGKVVITPDMTVAQALSLGIFQHAMKGSAKMAQLAAERTGGRPRQQIDLNVSATQDLAERMERSFKRAKESSR